MQTRTDRTAAAGAPCPPAAAELARACSPAGQGEAKEKPARDRYEHVSGRSVREHGRAVNPFLLNRYGPLGYFGPIGPFGPLGDRGPVGKNEWSASEVVSGADWSGLAKQIGEAGGPLSEAGPLGPNGPLAAYDALDAVPTDGHGMKAGGAFAVLGPLGPLGALGPLGPLGPVGAAGYKADEAGRFVDGQGQVHREVSVAQGGGRTCCHELFERYSEAHAKGMKDNDTSFLVRGGIARLGDADTFRFTSRQEQWVTALVVPERSNMGFTQAMGEVAASAWTGYEPGFFNSSIPRNFDNFDLEILDMDGNVLACSDLGDMADWVHMHVPAGTELQARVRLKDKVTEGDQAEVTYRLVVVGSTEQFHTVDAGGPHVRNWQ